jgi:putative oxygen-independent coproporphyrinogen III oxidase
MENLALYIHWPFCRSKCPYCDFNSHVRNQIDVVQWYQGFRRELTRTRQVTGPRKITSIFFGGGTPSLMPPELVEDILETASELWEFIPDIEITLEANPTSVEADKFSQLAQAGVNRLSIGVQSFNADALHFLGRQHSPGEAIHAIETAQRTVNRVTFDLIYARPHQTIDQWQQELTQALSFGTSHLSLYQLTIEPGTAFATQYKRGDFQLPQEEEGATLYETTLDLTHRYGLKAYEVSNYAQNGQESRHNLTYWRYQDYAGIGPGAHGRLTLSSGEKMATKQYRAPETWLTQVLQTGSGDDEIVALTQEEQAVEKILMGLRLNEPFDLSKLPVAWETIIHLPKLTLLTNEGFLDHTGSQIQATLKGRLCLNAVLSTLLQPAI